MLKRIVYIATLAFALLFAQQGAAWHALSHVGGAPGRSQSEHPTEHPAEHKLPHGEQCTKCAAFSQVGAACTSVAPPLDLATFGVAPPLHAATSFYRLSLSVYQSRAPPRRV